MAQRAQVNIHEAKTHFSKLLARVERGEDIVIARAGRPVAKLVAFGPCARERKPGRLEGRVVIRPSFYEEDPELIEPFYTSKIVPDGDA